MGKVQCTANIKNTIKIEKTKSSEIANLVLNPKTRMLYIAYREFLLVIDLDNNNVIGKINTDKFKGNKWYEQRQLVVNESLNKLFVLLGDTIQVIDGFSIEKESVIKLGKFADFICVNSISNQLYVSFREQNILQVYDCTTLTKISEITLKAPTGMAVDLHKNKLYIANSKSIKLTSIISVIDTKSFDEIDTISFPINMALNTFQTLDRRIFINESRQILYVFGTISGVGGGYSELFVVDVKGKKLVTQRSVSDYSVTIDQIKDRFYIRDDRKNTILCLDEHANKEISSFCIGREKIRNRIGNIISSRHEQIFFNPLSQTIFQTNSRNGLLYEIVV